MRKSMLLGVLVATVAYGRDFRGTYEVPVTDPALAPYAQFEVKLAQTETYDTELPPTLHLELPRELTGTPRTVRIDRVGGTMAYTGEKLVEGSCQRDGRDVTCEVKMQNLAIDMAEVNAFLGTQTMSDAERALRLRVAAQFASEPIGIFRYRLRGGSR